MSTSQRLQAGRKLRLKGRKGEGCEEERKERVGAVPPKQATEEGIGE